MISTVIAAVAREAVVALEADIVDSTTGEPWSVIAVGIPRGAAGRAVRPRVCPRADRGGDRGHRSGDHEVRSVGLLAERGRGRLDGSSGGRSATVTPASQPGARPFPGGDPASALSPAIVRAQEITEFEFHISPVRSSSLPHTGVGTDGMRSSTRLTMFGSFEIGTGLATA
jgi:hypothetical protein